MTDQRMWQVWCMAVGFGAGTGFGILLALWM